jgi:alkylation response protein AidB-like acyl-CoA dehydrogenase
MDLSFNSEDETFRAEVQGFIAEAYTDDLKQRMSLSRNGSIGKNAIQMWQKRLAAKGWLGINWPEEHGGPGFSQTQKYIFDIEMSKVGAPSAGNMGITMCGPVIMEFGTEAQKKEHLPKIRAGDIWWCQGYSEPGSGSDLASLQLKTEVKDDHFLINGSKTWTTYAQYADWMFCLCRTDNSGKKQMGISFILIDMKTPGITIEPIVTIDQPVAGQQEVNQVFFDDVKVPLENLVGNLNEGWTCAKYLLQFERGNSHAPGLHRALVGLKSIASQEASGDGDRLIDDPSFRMKLSDAHREIQSIEYNELRIFAELNAGQAVGARSSMLKLAGSEMGQKLQMLGVEATSYYAMPFDRDTFGVLDGETNEGTPGPDYASRLAPTYFNHRKTTIYGGSSEVQRMVMAKSILGL